jgi:hypoxanthine phosphoribosyltransferase
MRREGALRAVPPHSLDETYLAADAITARVRELGADLARDYAGLDPLLVVVLRGAFVFASDLSRAVPIPHALDFVSLAGYAGPLGGSSAVRLMKDLDTRVEGRHLVVVENVVDTGLTLNYLLKAIALRDPADVAICTLLDRPYRRLVDDLPIRYVGFTAPDEFFVGYGFSLEGRYRGLPDLRVLRRR